MWDKTRVWQISLELTHSTAMTYCVGLAERVGFEPTVEFPLHTLSKRAPSTTRTSLPSTRLIVRSLTAGRLSGINSLPERRRALQKQTVTWLHHRHDFRTVAVPAVCGDDDHVSDQVILEVDGLT